MSLKEEATDGRTGMDAARRFKEGKLDTSLSDGYSEVPPRGHGSLINRPKNSKEQKVAKDGE